MPTKMSIFLSKKVCKIIISGGEQIRQMRNHFHQAHHRHLHTMIDLAHASILRTARR